MALTVVWLAFMLWVMPDGNHQIKIERQPTQVACEAQIKTETRDSPAAFTGCLGPYQIEEDR